MKTNKNAPVYYSGKIIINSSAENVWKILSDIDNWPQWQKAIEYARLNGELTPGTTFDWKNGSSKIHSTLHTVKAPNYIGWTGKSMGINAVHSWKITSLGNGTTEVFVEESMEGLLTKLMKNYLNKIVKQALQKSLEELKIACEQKI
ncbi:MAG: SRPBCC family protein [Petrimonas sp.]|nr:SRPBCC family protein [Petrimonas sp.]